VGWGGYYNKAMENKEDYVAYLSTEDHQRIDESTGRFRTKIIVWSHCQENL
jgi:hypothetical protein